MQITPEITPEESPEMPSIGQGAVGESIIFEGAEGSTPPKRAEGSAAGASEPSLTSRVVKGAGWLFAGRIAGRVLQMVKLIILARLLAPEDFGLFGIVLLAMAAIETFTKTGFNAALVQRRGDITGYLNTAWTVGIVRGLFLAAIIFFSAPLIGRFFGEPRAAPLLRVLCSMKIIGSLGNMGPVYWQRELEFHKKVIFNFITSFVTIAVGITLAFILRNVWALVWSSIAGAVATVLLSYIMHPYRPRLSLEFDKAKDLVRFGVWMLGSSIMTYAGSQFDNLFVGKLLGTAALGFYVMAYNFSLIPLRETTYAISSVLTPSYAKLQNDSRRLKSGYERALSITGFFSIPACLGMILLASPAVDMFLGDQWLPIILPIQILMAAQIFKSIASTGSPFFLGSGNPRYEFYAQVARVVGLTVFLIPALLLFELEGAALAVVISGITMFVSYYMCLSNILDHPGKLLIKALMPSLTGGFVMSAALLYPAHMLNQYSGSGAIKTLLLIATILLGAGVYFAVALSICRLYADSLILKDIIRLWQTLKTVFAKWITHKEPLANES